MDACCYIVSTESSKTMIVDPGGDAEKILEYVEKKNLQPVFLVQISITKMSRKHKQKPILASSPRWLRLYMRRICNWHSHWERWTHNREYRRICIEQEIPAVMVHLDRVPVEFKNGRISMLQCYEPPLGEREEYPDSV